MTANSGSITLLDGRELAYDLCGPANAPIVLLSNSLMTNYALWNHFTNELVAHSFRVLRYDPSGHGGSSAPQDPSSTTFITHSNDVAELLKALNIAKIHAWIGISMGAATGTVFVTQNPGVVQKLILSDTITSSPGNAGVPDLFTPRAEVARTDSDGIKKLTEGTLQRWFSEEWRAANSEETERMRRLMHTTTKEGFIACCHALAHKSFDLNPLLRNISSCAEEVLLVVGERDANLPDTMESMRQEIQAGFGDKQQIQLAMINGAGHVPVIDGREDFNRVVLGFISHKLLNKI